MAIKYVLTIMLLSVIFTFCDSSDNIVGSNEDVEINNVSFNVDTTYLESNVLYAKGTVTNLGTTKINSPWYVEGQFYTDQTYNIKLGGNNSRISVPLEPYQSTFWVLSYSTTKVDVNQYPNFRISDLRGIYKN
ncbi:MAG: hypothetical protein GY936_15130 [Ignavibacteriae bacterium]|nr:hypothetical protein [Ignavibacteriota bacterium]